MLPGVPTYMAFRIKCNTGIYMFAFLHFLTPPSVTTQQKLIFCYQTGIRFLWLKVKPGVVSAIDGHFHLGLSARWDGPEKNLIEEHWHYKGARKRNETQSTWISTIQTEWVCPRGFKISCIWIKKTFPPLLIPEHFLQVHFECLHDRRGTRSIHNHSLIQTEPAWFIPLFLLDDFLYFILLIFFFLPTNLFLLGLFLSIYTILHARLRMRSGIMTSFERIDETMAHQLYAPNEKGTFEQDPRGECFSMPHQSTHSECSPNGMNQKTGRRDRKSVV